MSYPFLKALLKSCGYEVDPKALVEDGLLVAEAELNARERGSSLTSGLREHGQHLLDQGAGLKTRIYGNPERIG
jgi:hypothetical protein